MLESTLAQPSRRGVPSILVTVGSASESKQIYRLGSLAAPHQSPAPAKIAPQVDPRSHRRTLRTYLDIVHIHIYSRKGLLWSQYKRYAKQHKTLDGR